MASSFGLGLVDDADVSVEPRRGHHAVEIIVFASAQVEQGALHLCRNEGSVLEEKSRPQSVEANDGTQLPPDAFHHVETIDDRRTREASVSDTGK